MRLLGGDGTERLVASDVGVHLNGSYLGLVAAAPVPSVWRAALKAPNDLPLAVEAKQEMGSRGYLASVELKAQGSALDEGSAQVLARSGLELANSGDVYSSVPQTV